MYQFKETPERNFLIFNQMFRIPPGIIHFFQNYCPGSKFETRTNTFSYSPVNHQDVYDLVVSYVDEPRVRTTYAWYDLNTSSIKIDQDELITVYHDSWQWNPDLWHNIEVNDLEIVHDKFQRTIKGSLNITVFVRPDTVVLPVPDSKIT